MRPEEREKRIQHARIRTKVNGIDDVELEVEELTKELDLAKADKVNLHKQLDEAYDETNAVEEDGRYLHSQLVKQQDIIAVLHKEYERMADRIERQNAQIDALKLSVKRRRKQATSLILRAGKADAILSVFQQLHNEYHAKELPETEDLRLS